MTRDLATTADARALEAAREAYEHARPGRRLITWARLYDTTHEVLAREVKSAARGRG